MSEDILTILGEDIPRGQSAFLEVEIAKLHTRNSLKMPVIVERSKVDGPVLLLIGGVHGDEINGVAIVREIIRNKLNIPKIGTVICIPVFNVFGYLNHAREFPDGRDLNRVFPGSPKGSLASQFAYKFIHEIAPLADYAIDFHTGGAGRENFPNIRCSFKEPALLEMAKVFNAPYTLNSKFIPKSLRHGLFKLGVPSILFEGGKSLELDQKVIDAGVQGTINIMSHLGMCEPQEKPGTSTVILQNSRWIRANYSGLFQSLVENGTRVPRKTLLGKIYDPFGEFERKIYSSAEYYVFGLNTAPIVNKGDALFHVSPVEAE